MKNIPIFTAPGGTATLILREIPKTGRAYAILQTHTAGMEPELVQDCAVFCRLAGAREVYVSSADSTALALPHSHDMLRLQLNRATLPPPERQVDLRSVIDPEAYIVQYNSRFSPVLNAAMCDRRSLERAAAEGTQHWLAYHNGVLIGLGAIRDNTLEAVASLQPGWGRDLTCTLLAQTSGPVMELTVCSENQPAMRLYDTLGFVPTVVLSRWYHAS